MVAITGKDTSSNSFLRLATLNITDARNACLNAAICCMKEMKVDISVLTETKLHHNKYTKSYDGYNVVAMEADKRKGGVALVYRANPDGWALEDVQKFGCNVIKAILVSGQQRFIVVGACISPSGEADSTLASITEACRQVSNRAWPLILLGDFNVDPDNIGDPSRPGFDRRLETSALIESIGLTSTKNHFRQQKQWLGKN